MYSGIHSSSVGARIPELSWARKGRLAYLTGGTTGCPKQVSYDERTYRDSVRTTAEILAAHGVCSGTRLAICHPFDPWAIGGIFRDAGLACGAEVLPLGLAAGDPSLLPLLFEFAPQAVCGTASLLVRWAEEARVQYGFEPDEHQRLVFHAAEPLRPELRRECSRAWNARVIDIYGMAEFDSIAAEGVCSSGLVLCPDLDARILSRGGTIPQELAPASVGTLFLRRHYEGDWISTRDEVRVVGKSDPGEALWPNAWLIEHLGRVDDAINLPDGTLISRERFERAISKRVAYRELQIRLKRERGILTKVALAISGVEGKELGLERRIRRQVLADCFELADAVRHGVIEFSVEIVSSNQIRRNLRGKVIFNAESNV